MKDGIERVVNGLPEQVAPGGAFLQIRARAARRDPIPVRFPTKWRYA
jgi:hypothetical protein